LHQADFPGASAAVWIEAGFSPDDGLDQRGRDAITPRGGKDGRVLAVVAPVVPPPNAARPADKQEDKQPGKRAPFHGMVVMEVKGICDF